MEQNTIRSIGVVMDGNRRWAKEQGKKTITGHKAGAEKLKEMVSWAKEAQVTHVIAYAFSTENWNRDKAEVSYLMDLIRYFFKQDIQELHENGVRIRIVGDMGRFQDDIQELLRDAEDITKNNTNIELGLALSYGGRAEILQAVNSCVREGEKITSEEDFAKHLWTSGFPDPELIIRTGGKQRLSNFLPWQSVYSELYFTDTLWPDITQDEFLGAMGEYQETQRNFGK